MRTVASVDITAVNLKFYLQKKSPTTNTMQELFGLWPKESINMYVLKIILSKANSIFTQPKSVWYKNAD